MNYHHTEILLVEDSPHEANLTIMSLKEHNLDKYLFHVEDGAEALDFIFAKGKYAERQILQFPKIILLDINLPKVNGLEVLRQIKEHETTKTIPVAIISSSKQDKDIRTGYQLGANTYVVKPVEYNSFTKAVKDIGMYWLFLNEAPGRR